MAIHVSFVFFFLDAYIFSFSCLSCTIHTYACNPSPRKALYGRLNPFPITTTLMFPRPLKPYAHPPWINVTLISRRLPSCPMEQCLGWAFSIRARVMVGGLSSVASHSSPLSLLLLLLLLTLYGLNFCRKSSKSHLGKRNPRWSSHPPLLSCLLLTSPQSSGSGSVNGVGMVITSWCTLLRGIVQVGSNFLFRD